MKTVLAWIQAFATAIGGPGLFIIAFLDSSFLSFPLVADQLVVSTVLDHPERMVFYALMATAGSVAGCLSIYFVARKGGDALIRRRVHARLIDRATGLMQRHGVWALAVPAILPPPAPFKVFVLLAGASEMPVLRFSLAIGGARALRYLALGILTVLYGRQALDFLTTHGRMLAYTFACGILLPIVLVSGWRRFRRRRGTLTSVSGVDIMP